MRFALPLFVAASTAQADVTVRFFEGAPKDAFEITATNNCLSGPVQITLDLSGSDAGLIFDVTAAGQGVEVSQPFELVAGRHLVTGVSAVADGDTRLDLTLSTLTAAQPVRFTIDLDDTMGAREITVSGAEIAGALVTVTTAGGTAQTVFDANAQAVVPLSGCNS